MQGEGITNVVHVIQLAVAPVFLLTGVGAILSVLVARLGRIVDRLRVLGNLAPTVSNDARAAAEAERGKLARRGRLIHSAISLCTTCALLICAVIATLFIGALMSMNVSGIIAFMFILAMLALIVGLVNFLREIHLATDSVHVR